MTILTTITFRDMPRSEALYGSISQHADRLQRFSPQPLRCDVAVQRGESRHTKGNRYEVRARLSLPGGEFEAGRSVEHDHSHEDPYVAVRDTFDALRRQLEDFVRIRRGDVKTHATGPTLQ